jgi:phospholipid/cholesterol/gamma-HCH transport system permease protein
MYLDIKQKSDTTYIYFIDEWSKETLKDIEKLSIPKSSAKIIIDVSRVTKFDSAGIIEFIKIFNRLKKEATVEVVGYTQKQKEFYELLKDSYNKKIPIIKENFFEDIGKAFISLLNDIKIFFSFLGEFCYSLLFIFRNPKNFRYKEIIYHIYQSGVMALVIVALTAFLIGLVIAYQAGAQLTKFGADIYIVDTVGISITRELAPMVTAIVIAGRSGSAYTAEIGAMKITQELDAMKTFAFDVYLFLVLPRVIALMIALPLLIFFADIIGIFGGMVAAKAQVGISFDQFILRTAEVLKAKHYILGLIKAPFFAMVIALIGCFRGFEVENNTESLGLKTTQSVVNSIFLVIAFDALFSVIYTELGL